LIIQDAGGHHVLASHPFISEPTWSPDGLAIAYEAEGALWVVDVETGESSRVLEDVQNAGIAWTQAGETIFATKGESIVSVATDGQLLPEEVLVLRDPIYDAPQLSVSPDGQAIAIGNDAGLSIGTFSSGDLVKVTELSVQGMAWSPDGRSLALGVRDIRGTGAAWGVYLASREGDKFVQLTEASGRIHEVQYWLLGGVIMFRSHAQFI